MKAVRRPRGAPGAVPVVRERKAMDGGVAVQAAVVQAAVVQGGVAQAADAAALAAAGAAAPAVAAAVGGAVPTCPPISTR